MSELVGLATANARQEADAKAYGIDAMMKAFAASRCQGAAGAGQRRHAARASCIALAFRDLADNAAKIGQLNVSPDLLREIIRREQQRAEP